MGTWERAERQRECSDIEGKKVKEEHTLLLHTNTGRQLGESDYARSTGPETYAVVLWPSSSAYVRATRL